MAGSMTAAASLPKPIYARPQGFLRRLVRDTAGNVMIITAASLFPLLALIGSGIDMGRGYLAQSRLQQACDAGTLAARKRLGTMAAVNGQIPDTVADTGQRFFNINFRADAYGSESRQFVMTLEDDYAISGIATAEVPTTVMGAFGFGNIAVSASCAAQINMPNTDVMLVLDTTGSMLQTNVGDTQSRIDVLRNTVKSFHAQMEANKATGTRIRYGFLPYSTNVNVGHLLRDEWLVDEWSYNFRTGRATGRTTEVPVYQTESQYRKISGTSSSEPTYYTSECPASTRVHTLVSSTTDGDGWTHREYYENGTSYGCRSIDGGVIEVTTYIVTDHRYV